jgi:hypothetical protein
MIVSSKSKIAINCEACFNDGCKEIAKRGGFRYWGCMEKYLANDHKPKVLLRALIPAIKEFLLDDPCYWGGGQFLCKAPYGTYIWHFAVRMKQEVIWQFQEFLEGREYGCNSRKPDRDMNRYQEPSRSASWDCGYILGLKDRKKKEAGNEQ